VKVSLADIRHVAMLARLELSPEEEAAMTTTLDAILTYVDQLSAVDTAGIEPTAHILDLATPWRDDEVVNQPDTEALLRNAPARDGNFFRVPKIIE
jgi:aspartyl-tRNA(Asn)/glutamyl-tRNA(Gln) amidotransferase subunit C